MVFFLSPEGRVYARYGGRDSRDADARQSLLGLRYTMESVLAMHQSEEKRYAPRKLETPKYVKDLTGKFQIHNCMHCHQVKESLDAAEKDAGRWRRESTWRYPLPENLGFALEVDRGNVVASVSTDSPAAKAGLQVGDVLDRLNDVPIHSFADAQYALDSAGEEGEIAVAWKRGEGIGEGRIAAERGWRKTDVSWRPSQRRMIPSARMYGENLTPAEKQELGLAPTRLAFRQNSSLTEQAKAAGVHEGDIVLGFDGQTLEMSVDEFRRYVKRNYLIGDLVTVNVIREGRPLELTMTLGR